jgi:hypothetical protein
MGDDAAGGPPVRGSGPLRAVLGWLTGRPPVKPRPAWRRWTLRALTAAFLGWLFLIGPCARFLPFVPGFHRLEDGKNTIFCTPDLASSAEASAAQVRGAETAVLEFWGEPAGDGFPFGLDVYLCGSLWRYAHLIGNRAPASASLHDIFVNMTFPVHERGPFLRHELSHAYGWHRMGGFLARLRTPAWLDEGIATVVQDSTWQTEEDLRRRLERRPELASLASTPNLARWLSAHQGDSKKAVAQYVYARVFTEHLIREHGKEKVLAYLLEATESGEHEAAFERRFGAPLLELEEAWVAERVASGFFPSGTRLVDRGLRPAVVAKFALAPLLLLLLLAWGFRQLCRLVRLAAGLRQRYTAASSP